MVFYLESLSWQTNTTLNIVLATVGRTCCYLAKLLRICLQHVLSHFIQGTENLQSFLCRQRIEVRHVRIAWITIAIAQVVVFCLIVQSCADGITCGIVEHYDIVKLYLSKSFYSTIVPMWPLYVALALHNWQSVLSQWHCERSLWDTWSVAHFRYKQVIASK